MLDLGAQVRFHTYAMFVCIDIAQSLTVMCILLCDVVE